jgi:CubicO group peptidase (beta-lactamase class C family)
MESRIAGIHARRVVAIVVAVALVGTAAVASGQPAPLAQDAATLTEIDRVMENYRLDAHIPGMVWGVVKDGKLVHAKGALLLAPTRTPLIQTLSVTRATP